MFTFGNTFRFLSRKKIGVYFDKPASGPSPVVEASDPLGDARKILEQIKKLENTPYTKMSQTDRTKLQTLHEQLERDNRASYEQFIKKTPKTKEEEEILVRWTKAKEALSRMKA
jgi:hypothetical protein